MKGVFKILAIIFVMALVILLVRWGIGNLFDGVFGSS